VCIPSLYTKPSSAPQPKIESISDYRRVFRGFHGFFSWNWTAKAHTAHREPRRCCGGRLLSGNSSN
jgi:hypothetical protein